MPKRIKVAVNESALMDREGMEALVHEICELTIQKDSTTVLMDQELAFVRGKYEARLAEYGERLEARMAVAKDWCERNPEEFGARKSIEMTHGTVGFRTGTPKLRPLSGWTWEKVKNVAGMILPDYIRTKAEVDKERILADREILAPMLGKIGVRVDQDESFFVEPKREELSGKLVTP